MGTGNRAQSLDIAGTARVEATGDRGETETSNVSARLRGQDERSDGATRETASGESTRASSVSGEAIQAGANESRPARSGGSVPVKESAEVANRGSGQESTVWSSLRQPGAGGTSKLAAGSSGAVRLLTLGRGGRVVQAPVSSAGTPKRPGPGAEVFEPTGRSMQYLEGVREGAPTSNARESREPQVVTQQGIGSKTLSRGGHHVSAGPLRHATELTRAGMPRVTTPLTVNRGSDFPALVRETPVESKRFGDQVRKGHIEVSQADAQGASRMSSSNAERPKTAAQMDSADHASTSKTGVSSLHLTDWTEDPDEEMNFSVPLDETLTGGVLSQRKSPERKQSTETQPASVAGDLKKASRPVGHFDWTDTEDEEDNSEPSVQHSTRMAGSSALSSRHQLDKTLGISELNPSGDHRMRADARLSVPPHSNDAGSDTRTLPVTHLGDAKEVSLAELSRELEILEEERQIVKQKAAERARQRREEEERLEKERRERAALKLRELEERIAANKAQKEAESQSTSRDARNKAAPRGKTDKTSSPAPRSGFGDARSGSVARNASLFKAGGAATKIDTERRQRSRERPTGSLEAESWRDSKRMMLAGAESARQAARLHQAPERARSGPTIRSHESAPASQGGASTIALERPRAIGDIRRLVAAEGVRDAAAGDTFKPELGRSASVSAERKVVKGPTGSITSSTRSSHPPTESHSERNASKTWRDASESDDHADVRFTNHSSAHPLRHGEISGGTHAAAVRLPLDVAALDERVLSTGPPSSWLNLPDAKITDDVAAIKGHRDRSEKIRREVPKRSATRAADGSAKWGLPDFPKPSFEDISRAFASTRPMMGSAPIAFGLAGLYSGNERASTESRETTMQAASTLAASSQRNTRDIDTPPGDVGATPSTDHRNLSSSMTVSTATALAAAANPNDATAGSESVVAPIASKASVTGSQLALSSSNESTFPREIPFHSDLRTDAPEFIPFVPYGSVGETGFVVAHADPAYISVQYGDAAQADLFSLPGYLPSSDWGSTVLSDSVDLQHLKDSDERGENAGPKRKTHMDDDDEDLAAAAISSALGEHRHRRGKTINDRRRERNSSMAPSRNQFQSESNTQVQAPSKLRERRWSLSAAARGNPTTSRPERRQSLALGPDANDRNEAQCTTQAGEANTTTLTGETRDQRDSTDATEGRFQTESETLITRTCQERHSKDAINALPVPGMHVQSIRNGRASHQNRNRSSRAHAAKGHRDTKRFTDKSVGTGHGRDRHHDETSDANEDEVDVNSGDKITSPDGAQDEHHRGIGGSGPQVQNQQLVRSVHDRSRRASRSRLLKLAAQRSLRRGPQTESTNIDQSASNTSTDASDPNGSVQRPLLEAPLETATAKGTAQVAAERPRQAPPTNRRRARQVSKSSDRSALRERSETALDSPNGAPTTSPVSANANGALTATNVSLSSEAERPGVVGKQAVRHQHRRGRDAAAARLQRRHSSHPKIDLSGCTNQNDDRTASAPVATATRDDLPKHNSVDDVAAQADTQSAVGLVSSSLTTTIADVTTGDTTPVGGRDRPAIRQPRGEARLQGRQHRDPKARRNQPPPLPPPPPPHRHRRRRGTPPGHGTEAQADERQSISGAATRTSGSQTESSQQTNK